MKKLLVLLSALALTFTLATAEGKCGNGQQGMMNDSSRCDSGKNSQKCDSNKQTMKCESGKCAQAMKCESGKCGGTEKKVPEKKVPQKGSCGQGKCG